MKRAELLSGMAAVAERYEGLILDVWGVLHDGRRPYPGVVDCLGRLRAAGRRICLLSNAPRRSALVVQSLANMGIASDLYDRVYTSGEAVWEHLADPNDEFHRRLGRRVYHMGPPRGDSILHDTGRTQVATPEEADFVVATGIGNVEETLADYEDMLQRSAARRLPLICANPDMVVNIGRRTAICAGTMAERYEQLGGTVCYHGKPHPPVYERCRALLDLGPAARTVMVGDSFHTDIAGANAAGIESILVLGGIHREELGLGEDDSVCFERLASTIRSSAHRPTWAIASLKW